MRGRKKIPGREGWQPLPRNIPVPATVYALITAPAMESMGATVRYFLIVGMVKDGFLKPDAPEIARILKNPPYPTEVFTGRDSNDLLCPSS